MNKAPMQHDHTRFIIGCITLLTVMCLGSAAVLIWKGYDSGGGQLVMAANSAISGMVGFLARGALSASGPRADVTVSGDATIQPQVADKK